MWTVETKGGTEHHGTRAEPQTNHSRWMQRKDPSKCTQTCQPLAHRLLGSDTFDEQLRLKFAKSLRVSRCLDGIETRIHAPDSAVRHIPGLSLSHVFDAEVL